MLIEALFPLPLPPVVIDLGFDAGPFPDPGCWDLRVRWGDNRSMLLGEAGLQTSLQDEAVKRFRLAHAADTGDISSHVEQVLLLLLARQGTNRTADQRPREEIGGVVCTPALRLTARACIAHGACEHVRTVGRPSADERYAANNRCEIDSCLGGHGLVRRKLLEAGNESGLRSHGC